MKKIIVALLAISTIFSSIGALADTKILIKNERGSVYSDKEWNVPDKEYITQSNGYPVSYKPQYKIEKATEKNAEITTDVKNPEKPVLLYYDKDGNLINVNQTADKKIPLEENVADVKGFYWQSGKLMPYGDTKTDMPKKINIILVGDSTACNWPNDYYPEEGYGKFLGDYFNKDLVKFYNHAVSGASTTSFLDDNKRLGYWPDTLNKVEPGTIVIMDLGANDRSKTKDENGEFSGELYKANMKKMYDDVKAKGGDMIFIAVAVNASDIVNDKVKIENSRRNIAYLKEELANELGCEFIGCQDDVAEFYNSEIKRLGSADNMRGLYFRNRKYLMDEKGPFALAYEDTVIPNNFDENKEYDYTHSTVYGADALAQIIYQKIMSTNSALKIYTK